MPATTTPSWARAVAGSYHGRSVLPGRFYAQIRTLSRNSCRPNRNPSHLLLPRFPANKGGLRAARLIRCTLLTIPERPTYRNDRRCKCSVKVHPHWERVWKSAETRTRAALRNLRGDVEDIFDQVVIGDASF
jgi:hypothetical protein